MLLQVILEGLGLGTLLVLVCAAGIRKGAVGMVHLYPMGQPFASIQSGLYVRLQRPERPFCQRLFPVSCKGRGQRDENADREDRIWRQTMKYAGTHDLGTYGKLYDLIKYPEPTKANGTV